MKRFTQPCFLLALLSSAVLPALAQTEFHHLTIHGGGGFTTATGRISDSLDIGGNVQVGGGYNFTPNLAITSSFGFQALGVTRSALNRLNQPDGNGKIYTITVDPKFTVPLGRGTSFYVLAGGGWLRRTVQFTQPTLASTFVFDPWWGYYGPALVPANQVLGSVSQNAGVWDIGGGFNFGVRFIPARIFVEARYYRGLTENTHTDFVPITVGVRW